MREDILQLLAGRRGHFQMESGYHSEWWFELGRLFDDPQRLQPFIEELAQRLHPRRIDAVCGPMTGGAKLAEIIAGHWGIESVYAERFEPKTDAGLFPVKYLVPEKFRARLRGKRVAIVDDAISAGSAVRGTYADLLACGAQPVAVGALVVFGETAVQFASERGLILESLARMSFGMWLPGDCPLCKTGAPVEKVSDAAETA